jgi:hypothetical protein
VVCKFCSKKFIKKNTFIKSSPNNFCLKSCAAKYNNHYRVVSIQTKKKISKKLLGKKVTGAKLIALRKRALARKKPDVKTKCKICKKKFYTYACPSKRRKTCSDICKIKAQVLIRPYQNGSKRITPYFNPFENKKVLLDSSWEVKVADLLCKYKIAWNRPEPLNWVDKKNKNICISLTFSYHNIIPIWIPKILIVLIEIKKN